MILWTIQTIEWYQKLLSDEVIYGSRQPIEVPSFLYGYHWLMKQMDMRISRRPFAECYPVWAWYQWHSALKRKPDLRSSAHYTKGTKAVRIEIEKDEKDVLLSDFLLWHIPLSYHGYIGDTEDKSVAFENMLEQKGWDRKKIDQLPKNIRQEIVKSWDKIFDIDFDDPYFAHPKKDKVIQATFWSLSIDEVRKVDTFTAR